MVPTRGGRHGAGAVHGFRVAIRVGTSHELIRNRRDPYRVESDHRVGARDTRYRAAHVCGTRGHCTGPLLRSPEGENVSRGDACHHRTHVRRHRATHGVFRHHVRDGCAWSRRRRVAPRRAPLRRQSDVNSDPPSRDAPSRLQNYSVVVFSLPFRSDARTRCRTCVRSGPHSETDSFTPTSAFSSPHSSRYFAP